MDPDELRTKLEALHPDSFGWALACSDRDPEAAREVLQMAYVDVLDGGARWSGGASFKTWFFAVIRNKARERRRRAWARGRGLARLLALGHDPEPVPNPESASSGAERARLLREALTRLSRRQRETLHLVFYQGLTLSEAADVLGLSTGTVSLHYERGKKRLRELMPREARP